MSVLRAVCAAATIATAAVPVSAQAPSSPVPQPSGAPSAAPSPAVSPVPPAAAAANLAKARAEFEAWQNGKVDLARYIPEARAQFTDAAVKSVSDQLKALGAVKTLTLTRTVTSSAAVVYVYHVVCAAGAMDQGISWDAGGKIQYIQFVPPQ
jgi:hypothetical protein